MLGENRVTNKGQKGDSSQGTPRGGHVSGSSGRQIFAHRWDDGDLHERRQAQDLWAKDRIPESLRLFDRTARRHPNHVLAVIDASRAFGNVYQFQRAEALLRRLREQFGNRPKILCLIAHTYRLIRRPEQATECFQQALAAGSKDSDAQLELAILHERSNQLTRSWEHIIEFLRQRPGDNVGLLLKGKLLRRLGEPVKAETVLRNLAARDRAHWQTRMRANCELAALYESQTAYTDAWRVMLKSKAIALAYAASARRHRDRIIGPLTSMAQDLKSDDLKRWQITAIGPDSPPVALLTGMPRSGTTLLQAILDVHPSIVSGDEWDAFPRLILPLMVGRTPLQQLGIENISRLPEQPLARKRHRYFRSFEAALGEPIAGRQLIDKNPSLLPLLPVYQRLLPNSRQIFMMRDPGDVLISCLMTYFPISDFSVDFLSLDTAATRLASDLDVWLTLREKTQGRWIEVKYEQLTANLSSTLKGILNQLELPWDDRLIDYHQQIQQRHIHSPSYNQVQRPVHREAQGRWHHYVNFLEPVMPILNRLRDALGYTDSPS